jgi:murein DD-endopeptidase MepM/ murein hydrolase activator NlpD
MNAAWCRAPFWIGLLLGGGGAAAVLILPYVNWQPIVPPLDERPLVIRHDAKGDGRFSAPRSGARRHRGIDLAAALHAPVRAIRSGVVVQVGAHRGLGRFVELEHRHQVRSLYAHLQQVHVVPGARVRQGARIGTVGKTGNARHPWISPHLHLEIVKAGVAVDPKTLGLEALEPSLGALHLAEGNQDHVRDDESDDARGGE